jgi:hypothetical protein
MSYTTQSLSINQPDPSTTTFTNLNTKIAKQMELFEDTTDDYLSETPTTFILNDTQQGEVGLNIENTSEYITAMSLLTLTLFIHESPNL